MEDVYEAKRRTRRETLAELDRLFAAKILPPSESPNPFLRRLARIPEVVSARNLMVYLSFRSEVPTFPLLPSLFGRRNWNVIPKSPLNVALNGDVKNNETVSNVIRHETERRIVEPKEENRSEVDITQKLNAKREAEDRRPTRADDPFDSICLLEKESRRIVVPYCVDSEIRLYRLQPPTRRLDTGEFVYSDLAKGRFGILEPDFFSRSLPERRADPNELDVVLVPGVAFDRSGGRLGRGAGFYDRFFKSLNEKTLLVALAFDQQIVETVPTEPHDRPMDIIITPSSIYRRRTI